MHTGELGGYRYFNAACVHGDYNYAEEQEDPFESH